MASFLEHLHVLLDFSVDFVEPRVVSLLELEQPCLEESWLQDLDILRKALDVNDFAKGDNLLEVMFGGNFGLLDQGFSTANVKKERATMWNSRTPTLLCCILMLR